MPVEDICDCLYDEARSPSAGSTPSRMSAAWSFPDDASVIVLYCADGSRSCQAVQHMEAIGYVNVIGGIIDWSYEVVTHR